MFDRRKFLLALAVGAYAPPLHAQTHAPRIHRVEIENFVFKPARIEVRAGDIVVWLNRDFAPHTATADNKGWGTGLLKKDATPRLVARRPGRLSYHCAFHPHMKGMIVVAA